MQSGFTAERQTAWRALLFCGHLLLCVMLLGGMQSAAAKRILKNKRSKTGVCVLVTDDAGVAIADAVVEAVGDAGTAQARSGVAGACVPVVLKPGVYSIAVTAVGYAASVEKNVRVQAGLMLPLVGRLQSAAGSAAMLASVERTELAGDTLPVEERDVNGYLPLTATANAVPDVGRNPEADTAEWISVRGVAQTAPSMQLEGMGYSEMLSGGARGSQHAASGALGFSTEAVSEFALNSGRYSARDGGLPGAVVNALERRSPLATGLVHGAFPVHGTAFLFMRSNVLDATNPFSLASTYDATTENVVESVVKPHDLRLQWGVAVGGTLARGRGDWGLVYDEMYRDFPVVSSPSSPTFFSLTADQIAQLAGRGVTTTQIASAMEYLVGETGISPRDQKQWNLMPRFGWQLGERDRLSANANALQTSGPASGMGSPVVARAANGVGTSTLGLDSGALRWLHFLTENLANEFRAQYSHELVQEFSQANVGPQVSMGVGGMTLGTASYLPRSAWPDENAFQVADTLTWVHGKHTVSGGVEWTRTEEKTDALRYSNGAFSYNDVADWISDYTYNNNGYKSGAAAVDGVCGANSSSAGVPPGSNPLTLHYECFSRFTQAFGAQRLEFDTGNLAAYVEEEWKLHPRLSVNAGVRYEYEQLPTPQLPDAALDAAFAGVGSTSVYPEDKNNFGPRVGVAWQAFRKGRGVVRAGYGVFYGQVLNSTLETALQNTGLPTCDGSTAEHCQLSVSPTVTDTLNGYPNTFPNYAATAGIAPSKYNRSVLMGPRFRTPMIQQGELNIEHEVGKWMTVSGTYLVSLSKQLPNIVDANISPAPSTGAFVLQGAPVGGALGTYSGDTFLLPYYQTRVNSTFGPVSEIVSNINGYYDALVVEATRRLQHGVGFDAHWTWSKAIDYGQTIGGLGVASGASNDNQFDPYTLGYDKGLSSFNVPHKVVAAAYLEPRWRLGNKRTRSVVNGWDWTPLFIEQSGYAYSYGVYGGTSLSGGHQSINKSGGAQYLPTVGRNTLRLPDTYNLNLRVSRVFALREHLRLEAVLESYNLMNHLNQTGMVTTAYQYQAPLASGDPSTLIFQDATQTSTPFGQYIASATGRYAERQIQLALRLHF